MYYELLDTMVPDLQRLSLLKHKSCPFAFPRHSGR